ncbi:MAG: ACP S-malonyltransferase, partial [Alphaproteobacteria bacterium]|nr:ACP S-malonyltransferase [Alphaproteobacteria bacterium]
MKEKTAFIFPGQGSQSVEMGKDLYEKFPEAKAVFQEVDEALHQNLSRLMFEGDIKELTQTQNAQPAIMAVSMAGMRALEANGFSLKENASFVAGHSLGEYTALCAAGVLTLSQT